MVGDFVFLVIVHVIGSNVNGVFTVFITVKDCIFGSLTTRHLSRVESQSSFHKYVPFLNYY
jgi:hypothetical protein